MRARFIVSSLFFFQTVRESNAGVKTNVPNDTS
jgi:hypothetical protein